MIRSEVFEKQDEIRLRTLQRLMFERSGKGQDSKLRRLLNPANIIVLLVLGPAAAAILVASAAIDQLPIGLFGLAMQTLAILSFFLFPKIEKLAGRLVLGCYVIMYGFLMWSYPESHAIYVFAMFMHAPFAYVVAGYIEALVWSNILTVLVATSGLYHLSANPQTFGLTLSELIVAVAAMFTATLFIHSLDMVAKFSSKNLREKTHTLEDANARYDFILNSIGDGFIATDISGKIELISNSTARLTGFAREQLVGKNLTEVLIMLDDDKKPIEPADHPLSIALRTGVEQTTTAASRKHFWMVKKSRMNFPVGFSISPIIASGKTNGAVMIFQDIAAEQQVDRAKSEFVSLASHQLRTPLNVVSWYTEKLRKGKGGELNEKGKDYLVEIETSNRRMIDLVSAILNVSRIELGRLKIQYSDVDIVDLTRRLIKEVAPLAEQNKQMMLSNFMSDSFIVHNTDTEHVTVVVQNLLSNAIKYTPPKGSIAVDIHAAEKGRRLSEKFDLVAPKEGVIIAVTDTGIGIPVEQQNQIFGKLFRSRKCPIYRC